MQCTTCAPCFYPSILIFILLPHFAQTQQEQEAGQCVFSRLHGDYYWLDQYALDYWIAVTHWNPAIFQKKSLE